MNEDIPVKLDIHAGVATLTLNRPEKRNALDNVLIGTLTQLLEHIQKNERVSIVILKNEGKDFCAGVDINWLRESIKESKEKNEQDAQTLAILFKTLYHLNKPTIAVVKGTTCGSGIGLVACCDIAIATPDAHFCFSEVKIGMIPAIIGPYVIATMSHSSLKRYMLTAESFGAKKARRLGLISEVIQSENIIERTSLLVEHLQNNGPYALQATKKFIHRLIENPVLTDVQLKENAALLAEIKISPEAQEGLTAFLEKRPPKWRAE